MKRVPAERPAAIFFLLVILLPAKTICRSVAERKLASSVGRLPEDEFPLYNEDELDEDVIQRLVDIHRQFLQRSPPQGDVPVASWRDNLLLRQFDIENDDGW